MLFHPDRAERLAGLADRLRTADDVTTDLISAIFYEASDSTAAATQKLKIIQLSKLIDAGAWTDAALALLEMELPHWKLRRLAYDDGEWHCALSLSREIPDWLDDAIETSHTNLSLTILQGMVEAMRRDVATSEEPRAPITPHMRPKQPDAANLNFICCDNFA